MYTERKVLPSLYKKSPPDFFEIDGHDIGISQKFKDIVEAFESGVHQFFPQEVTSKFYDKIEGQFYLFVVTQSFDSAVIESESDVYIDPDHDEALRDFNETARANGYDKTAEGREAMARQRENWYYLLGDPTKTGEEAYYEAMLSDKPCEGHKVVLDAKMIAGKHIWRDYRLGGYIFVSDAFHDALIEAGITNMEVNRNFRVFEK